MAEDAVGPTVQQGRRLARTGVIAATASRLFGRLVGVLFVVVLARTSSDETVAVYGYLLGTATLVAVLTDVGVAAVAGRDVAAGRYDAGAGLSAALPAQLASTGLAWVVTVVLVVVSGPPGVTAGRTALLLLFVALNGLTNLWSELLRGQGRPVAEAVLSTLSAVLLVGGGLGVVALGGGATPLLAVVAAKELLVLGICVALIRPRRGPGVRPRQLLRQSVNLAVAGTASVVLWRQGMVYIGAVGTVQAVATYVVASRFLDAGTTLASTIGYGLLPGAASLHEQGEGFRALALRCLGLCLLGGAIITVVGLLFTGPVVTTLFGARWEDAVPVVRVLTLAAAPVLVAYVAWFLLLAAFEERWLARAAVLATVVGTAVTAFAHRTESDAIAAATGTTAGAVVLAVALVGRLGVVLRDHGPEPRATT